MPRAPFTPAKVEELWMPIDGLRMRYLRAGSGHPLILVHGLLGYSFSWRFTVPALVDVATAYAIDLPGTGYSESTPGLDCRLHATAERLLKLVDGLGLRSYDLLGTSHGGAVAQMVAALSVQRDDPRLQRLILVAPVNPYSSHGRGLAPFFGSPAGSFLFRRTIARWRFLDAYWLARMFGDARRIPPDSLAGYRAPILERNGFEYGLRLVRTWAEDLRELEKILPTIAHYPTLLMWGTADPAVPFNSAEPLQKNFRDCRLVAFRDVGHLPYEEVPDAFNEALVTYLREQAKPNSWRPGQ